MLHTFPDTVNIALSKPTSSAILSAGGAGVEFTRANSRYCNNGDVLSLHVMLIIPMFLFCEFLCTFSLDCALSFLFSLKLLTLDLYLQHHHYAASATYVMILLFCLLHLYRVSFTNVNNICFSPIFSCSLYVAVSNWASFSFTKSIIQCLLCKRFSAVCCRKQMKNVTSIKHTNFTNRKNQYFCMFILFLTKRTFRSMFNRRYLN